MAGGYSTCLKDYVKAGNCIRDRPELWNQAQHVLASDKFSPTNRTRSSSVLLSGDEEEGSVL